MLIKTRYLVAVKAFFKQGIATVGHKPDRVTTNKHATFPRAIRHLLGGNGLHLTNQYLNNRMEQDHRNVKQRSYPMRGFGSFADAARFLAAFDELRQYFRVRSINQKQLPLTDPVT